MRAYVAPDGGAAEYSEKNIPYSPKRHLKINPEGVDEEDFVFILGYPARTYRHRPSHFLIYQYQYQLPYIQSLYSQMIDLYEELSKGDASLTLRYAPTIKSLSNTEKNYRGKLQGIRRLDLIAKKQAEEKELQNFINSNPDYKEKYGDLLEDISEVYNSVYSYSELNLWMLRFLRFSDTGSLLYQLAQYSNEISKPEDQRLDRYKGENLEATKQSMISRSEEIDIIGEPDLLMLFLNKLTDIEDGKKILDGLPTRERDYALDEIAEDIIEFFDAENRESLVNTIENPKNVFDARNSTAIKFASNLFNVKSSVDNQKEENNGSLNIHYARLLDIKRIWKNESFIPDANRTLRLTYGYIRGYSPSDAVYYSPITTLNGVIEKSYQGGDYMVPNELIELYKNEEFGDFYSPKYGGIPVAILYNTDTSGGNSGSPILNSKGELIGVNFDRAFEATINDFAWDESYSRSIGVDIRYVLWITQKIGGADHLLKELGL
jgi:hypothetical protein